MRTTIRIDDNLFAALKRMAADTGQTLTAIVQDALRESLFRRRVAERPAVDLPLFHGTGRLPGVDLSDSAALLDVMERDDGPA